MLYLYFFNFLYASNPLPDNNIINDTTIRVVLIASVFGLLSNGMSSLSISIILFVVVTFSDGSGVIDVSMFVLFVANEVVISDVNCGVVAVVVTVVSFELEVVVVGVVVVVVAVVVSGSVVVVTVVVLVIVTCSGVLFT